jgi:hypothetical protein
MANIPDDLSSQRNQQSIADALQQRLLAVKCKLELNEDLRLLSLLRIDTPGILAQEQFTRNEWCILRTILTSYPYYAPLELLLSQLTSLTPAECRKRLQEAQRIGSNAVKQELKPVHRAISSIRNKFADFSNFGLCLKISAIRELGYVLTISLDNCVWDKDKC